MENDREFFKGKNSDVLILFVHGTGSTYKFLRPLAKKITDYDSMFFDLPGHGNCDVRECDFNEYVEYVLNLSKDYKKVVLAGHSLGGIVVLSALSKMQKNIIAGIGISTSSSFYNVSSDHEFIELIKTKNPKAVEVLSTYTGDNDNKLIINTRMNGGLDPKPLFDDLLMDISLNIDDQVKNIDVPVLLMTGADDILALPEYAYKTQELIGSNCSVKEYDGFMHMLPLANRDAIVKDIVKFVDKVIEK